MSQSAKSVEFRIPISPTDKFFALVRFYNFALRRLQGTRYRDACLRIVVGDHCDLDAVRRANKWSEAFNIEWDRVPDEIFDEFNWAGTATWRLCLPSKADMVILSDADTVLLADIDSLLESMPVGRPAIRGHMAHYPPPLGPDVTAPLSWGPEFWPWLFDRFGMRWEDVVTHSYSMDVDKTLPLAPPYFNLGFVALNASALAVLGDKIIDTTRRVTAATNSWMRCQIAVTIAAHLFGVDIATLPAIYNAANDTGHLGLNGVTVDMIRVLHFLRTDEIDRAELQPDLIDGLLSRPLKNPANRALQALARDYRATL